MKDAEVSLPLGRLPSFARLLSQSGDGLRDKPMEACGTNGHEHVMG